MSFSERLKRAAEHAGVRPTQTEIAKALGYARQTVFQWFHGTLPETDKITNIAQAFRVDHTWLTAGEGDMVPKPAATGLTTEERDIIRFYRNAQPGRRKALYDMAKAIGKAIVVVALTIPALAPQMAEAAFNISKAVIHIGMRRWLCVIFRTSLSYFAAPHQHFA